MAFSNQFLEELALPSSENANSMVWAVAVETAEISPVLVMVSSSRPELMAVVTAFDREVESTVAGPFADTAADSVAATDVATAEMFPLLVILSIPAPV